jgi:hypothetical protein
VTAWISWREPPACAGLSALLRGTGPPSYTVASRTSPPRRVPQGGCPSYRAGSSTEWPAGSADSATHGEDRKLNEPVAHALGDAVMHCAPLTSRPRLWLSGFWYVGRLWYVGQLWCGSVGPRTRQKGKVQHGHLCRT